MSFGSYSLPFLILAYYVFQEEFNLIYLQSCCYWHINVLGPPMFDLLL